MFITRLHSPRRFPIRARAGARGNVWPGVTALRTLTGAMKRAGVGFREHTGWAAMVALGGRVHAPVVVARRRYELCEDDLPRAVYHAARPLDLENAEKLVRSV